MPKNFTREFPFVGSDHSEQDLDMRKSNSFNWNSFNWNSFEADYQLMIRAFKHIHSLSPKSKQDFVLSRIAKYFDVPRSAFGRLFKTWSIEQRGQR